MILLSIMGVVLHLIMQFIQKRVIFWAEPEQVIGA
jgi:ABC-type nitrate/sulfonate/bicarbonate transport system permease component